ncbi:glycosyltransferase [Bacteroidetes/Chlorobi group bacterium MS-B_bin-24]|jgi:cellulose synthase/poly-beta-1,6-N-acetylglucosamine synthase-like glycosyltransferase|nr:MAG: glycosyltransferase [Bacteroidetes/Chlorobi group bacterium MS-B_bin-24]
MEYAILIFYFLSLTVLFLFGVHGLVLLYYYHKTQKISLPQYELPKELPRVTIQLPIFNELYVVERLIRHVCKIRYPKDKLEIQVLDDSTDETQEVAKKLVEDYRAQGYDIHYIHRDNREGFKAGALKNGLELAKGEFIAIFDADFVPPEDFLEKTLPYFQNPQVGMVQTRWGHLNEDYSFLTKALALALDGHFVMEQQVRNRAGFFINFNGTAGIWRKETIIDAGNWQPDTLTEDLDLSYRAQLKGWKFVFLNDVVSPAELPADINGLKTQQFRWTKGAVETAKKILPLVLKSKLNWKVKLEAIVHLTSNIVFPFILVVALLNIPLVVIKNTFDTFDVYYNAMSIFVLGSIASFLFYLYSQKAIHIDWRNRILLFPVFLAGSMGLAINNTKAVIEALIGKKSGFTRTPKYRIVSNKDDWRFKKYVQRKISPTVLFEILLAIYYVIGIGISIYYLEIAAIPFQLLFLLGFGTVGYMSIRHALLVSK